MPAMTLDQIEALAARRYVQANGPAAVAVRAIGDLRHALEQCSASERRDVLNLLRDEVPAAAVCDFAL